MRRSYSKPCPLERAATLAIVYLPDQRLKISAALVPPKPNEFESAYSTSALRARLGT